ncbi:MAG: hypothetical protein ACREIB_11180, partial [Pseudomonadota bacterium]
MQIIAQAIGRVIAADCLEADGTAVPDGAYGVVFDGRVAVANDAGTVEFGEEEALYVSDVKT